jgi:hypothetical protein
LWSVAEQQQGAVLATAQLHQDMVTAVGFSLNGSRVLAGTMRGRVRFYELADKKLEYVAQVGQMVGLISYPSTNAPLLGPEIQKLPLNTSLLGHSAGGV